jgi:hypothetical protein
MSAWDRTPKAISRHSAHAAMTGSTMSAMPMPTATGSPVATNCTARQPTSTM